MKTGLTKKQKVTEFYFNELDDLAEIYTHNTDLKKRLLAYVQKYPELCKLTEEDEHGGLRFEIDKHRIGIRLTAPYSQERRVASGKRARATGFGASNNFDGKPMEYGTRLYDDPFLKITTTTR